MPLVCFCYGAAAMYEELHGRARQQREATPTAEEKKDSSGQKKGGASPRGKGKKGATGKGREATQGGQKKDRATQKGKGEEESLLAGASVAEIREQLQQRRQDFVQGIFDAVANMPRDTFKKKEEERFLSLHLITATNRFFTGQIARDQGKMVYASLFARQNYLP